MISNGYSANEKLLEAVDREIERLKVLPGECHEIIRYSSETNSPVLNLIKLASPDSQNGMTGIRLLIPYLTNTSPTKSFFLLHPRRSEEKRPALLNDYIARIIPRAASHQLYINDPEKISWFQKQIEDWCSQNANSKIQVRKIADLNDWFHSNRFAAYRWFAESKAHEGRLPLERRIDSLLNNGSLDTLTESEMAACAEALGAIGDKESIPAVERVCDNLRDYPNHSIYLIDKLFIAHQALAKLGEGRKALSALKKYYEKYGKEFEASAQEEFNKKLKEAENAQPLR
ncbi:MAG: hypothetical protein M3Y82_14885 [Verrucomicrobiota bacterium]|nr:hypothetical protein [Verrucomicrobiota bacterium]